MILSFIGYPSTSPSSSSNSIFLLFNTKDVFDEIGSYKLEDKAQFLQFTDGSHVVEVEVSIWTLKIFPGVPTFKGIV